jgi:hypothetical protein
MSIDQNIMDMGIGAERDDVSLHGKKKPKKKKKKGKKALGPGESEFNQS